MVGAQIVRGNRPRPDRRVAGAGPSREFAASIGLLNAADHSPARREREGRDMSSNIGAWIKRVLLATTVVSGLGIAAPCVGQASYHVFVKIDGIDGDSIDASYPRQIDALSFAWGVSQNASDQPSNASTVAGVRATFTSFNITKTLDKASVPLSAAAATGTLFKTIIITVVRDGAVSQPMVVFTLSDATVSAVSMAGAVGSSLASPGEDVSFAFAKIVVTYVVYDATGRPAGTVTNGWDLKTNRRV